jgi:hypothetical protein
MGNGPEHLRGIERAYPRAVHRGRARQGKQRCRQGVDQLRRFGLALDVFDCAWCCPLGNA